MSENNKMRPSEKARRAIIRSIDHVTELIQITKDDDNNPLSSGFKVSPPDVLDLTFSRVGVNEDTIDIFRKRLRIELPEIASSIDQMPLAPAVLIRLVRNHIKYLLIQHEKENAGGEV